MGRYIFLLFFILVVSSGCSADEKKSGHTDLGTAGEEDVGNKMVELAIELNILQEQSQFIISLTNRSNNEKTLEFSSSQKYEIIVTDENQNEIYRYSEGKMFTQAMDHVLINADKTIQWEETWDINEKELKAGFYEVKVSVLSAEPNNLVSSLTFEITE